jgi:hypothetical protein
MAEKEDLSGCGTQERQIVVTVAVEVAEYSEVARRSKAVRLVANSNRRTLDG